MFLTAHFWRIVLKFIKPEIEELIAYVIVFLSFITIALYQTFVSNTSDNNQDISAAFSLIQSKFEFITNGDDAVAKLFTFGLWFIIGTFVYALSVFLVSFASGAFQEVTISEKFVHPSTFHKSTFWGSILSRILIRSASAISLLFYTAFWYAVLAPVWLASFRNVFATSFQIEPIIDVVIALIGIVLSLHVGAILLRITILRSSYSYDR